MNKREEEEKLDWLDRMEQQKREAEWYVRGERRFTAKLIVVVIGVAVCLLGFPWLMITILGL